MYDFFLKSESFFGGIYLTVGRESGERCYKGPQVGSRTRYGCVEELQTLMIDSVKSITSIFDGQKLHYLLVTFFSKH